MTAFVTSSQIIQDLLGTLDDETATGQQLREALLRKSECDYTGQIVSSLDSQVGDFPDAVRALKQETGSTSLHSAKRYFLNDKSTPFNTSKLKYSFANQDNLFVLPLADMQSRNLITAYDSLDPDYQIGSDHKIITSSELSYVVNVKLSMKIYDGVNTPGPEHPSPSWVNTNLQEIYDLTNLNGALSLVGLEPSYQFRDEIGNTTVQHYGGFPNYIRPHQIIDFETYELGASYFFGDDMFSGMPSKFGVALSLYGPICNFGSREQHIGFFKKLQANDKMIDSSNYIDIICLGPKRVLE